MAAVSDTMVLKAGGRVDVKIKSSGFTQCVGAVIGRHDILRL